MASRTPRQNGKPHRPVVQTDMHRDARARYSYQETPMEMQRPVFQPLPSPTNSMIDESPLTPSSSSRQQPPNYDHTIRLQTPLREEKAFEASLAAPPQRMHPAYNAPIAERAPSPHPADYQPPPQPNNHYNGAASPPQPAFQPPQPQRQLQQQPRSQPPPQQQPQQKQPQPPLSPGPLPIKKPSPQLDHKLTLPRTETYNPSSLAGPNVGPSSHQPGQIPHPNSTRSPHWKSSLCEPDPLFCTALFCPCVVYSRTNYRLSRRSQKQDPTDLLGFEKCNGSCGLFALVCGVQGVLAAIHRTRIRKIYGIEGGLGADCMKGCCCCCCVVAQNEREVRDRETLIKRNAGPVTAAYTSPQVGMEYGPPPR